MRYEELLQVQRLLRTTPFVAPVSSVSEALRHAASGQCMVWLDEPVNFVNAAAREFVATERPFAPLLSQQMPSDRGIMWFPEKRNLGGSWPPKSNTYGFLAWVQGLTELGLVAGLYARWAGKTGYSYLASGSVEMDKAPPSLFPTNGVPESWDAQLQEAHTYFYCMIHFLAEEIVARDAEPLSRQRKKRIEATDLAKFSVIRLRSYERKPSYGEGNLEYDHRWVVTGHWRDQWYPRMQMHLPKWINPYVKGPEDKPLIVKDKVYAVVR